MLNLEAIFSTSASFRPIKDYLEACPLKNLSTIEIALVLGRDPYLDFLG
jgi:hypothetical protein